MYSKRMRQALAQRRKALVGFLLAGYPDEERFFDAVRGGLDNLDILEVGYPSYNPYGDGEVIQHAHAAVNKEAARAVAYWERLRAMTDKPIWVMAYSADFLATGAYRAFVERGVVDALVVPDADGEEIRRVEAEVRAQGVDVVHILNPGMSRAQMDAQLADASLVYEQLYIGKTGGGAEAGDGYLDMLHLSQAYPNVTRFAGFGLNSRAKIQAVLDRGFDGAIVGTELMRRLNESFDSYTSFLADIHEAVK